MANVTLFSQILQYADTNIFKKIVNEYNSDRHTKGINTRTHLISMLFCHFAKANSLREISNGLRSSYGDLNHLGIHGKSPSKSSLSYINERRDWRLFRDFYFDLKNKFQKDGTFKRRKFRIRTRKILILDSTTISVCLSAFNWARFRQKKGALKLHTLLDYEGCMPEYLFMRPAEQADVKFAQYLLLPSDSLVVADRAYLDFKMLYSWHQEGVNFVIRLKKSIKYEVIKERELPEGRSENILKDEHIILSEEDTYNKYPKQLRRVAAYDSDNDQVIEVITNNFSWTASTIAELYKQRWMIEIFFKELKQHLKIKSFIGTSENAVRIQIWTALITLLILKYLKELGKYNWCLSNLIAFLRMNLFVKKSLQEWLDEPFKPPERVFDNSFQCEMFT
jgi:hypothetical protein